MNNAGQFFIGIVESRVDPLKIGRCKVRVVGLHTHDKTILPTEDLPWAMLMQPVTGAAVNGIGSSAVGPVEGTSVVVIFQDYPNCQQPIIIGVMPGIPQGKSVNLDEFPDTPKFRDPIAPQGRPLPTTAAEATANQTGPLENTTNPTLSSIVNQSNLMATSTPDGIVDLLTSNNARTYGSVGGMVSSLNTLGSTYASAANIVADLVLSTGNSDRAISIFKTQISNHPIGQGIGALMNGKTTLSLMQKDLKMNIGNIQSQFNSIKNVNLSDPRSLSGLITNIDQFSASVGSLITDTSNLASIASYQFQGVASAASALGLDQMFGKTVPSLPALESVGKSLDKLFSSDQTEIKSILGKAESWAAEAYAGDFTGFDYDSVKGLFDNPALGEQIIGTGTSTTLTDAGISAVKDIPITQSLGVIDSNTFKDVAEGSSFPIAGVYGGPNASGQKPVIVPPAIDMSRYEGGSKADLQTSPPPNWRGDRTTASQSIAALLAAADRRGFTTNEQKAALLGIVGGECGWVPKSENCQYSSPDRLCEIFPSTFKNNYSLAEQYSNWIKGEKGPASEFFDFVYDPSRNGRQLGNTRPGDGGKYYGRGLIQLTGRSNYERYAAMSGHDIVNNPDLLNSDINISADIAVLYLMDRTKGAVPTAHPGFFYAARKAVGSNSPDIAARKLAYYEHFYGTKAAESFGYTSKIAGPTLSPYSYDGAYKGNSAGKSDNIGFKDPNNKYPLKTSVNEPDTHRLARGVIGETIVTLKESKRRIGVPIANNAGTWSEPQVPYGAQYPYNSVMETESGHIQEWDNTPGNERIHTYHRSGTYDEVDANGTRVNRIVGDKYTIVDNNGFVSIDGECSVTVGGNINVYCRSDANIQVEGSAEMVVGGNFDIGVARDMNIAVGGKFSLWSNGGMNLQTEKTAHILSNHNMFISSNNQLDLTSYSKMFVKSQNTLDIKVETDYNTTVGTGYQLNVGEEIRIKAADDVSLISAGTFATDAMFIHMNSDLAKEAGNAADATKALINGMMPPPFGVPIYPRLEKLRSPGMHGEEVFMYESNAAGESEASQAYIANDVAQYGKPNIYKSEEASAVGGGGGIKPIPTRSLILNNSNFNADFKLSNHFNLGMMFDGGFNVRHRLINQNGLTVQQIVANLAALCENILEPYLAELPDGIAGYNKSWRITSGYRMGTNTSDHSRGRAVDIQLTSRDKPAHHELVQRLDKIVPYDQMILEYAGANSVWIHTGFRGGSNDTFGGGQNRKEAFTMNNHKTYSQGFVLLG